MKELTIEELKSLQAGDWVWIIDEEWIEGRYREVSIQNKKEANLFYTVSNFNPARVYCFSDYGTKWKAYKNKELAECNEENFPLLIEVQALHWTCLFKDAQIRELESILDTKISASGHILIELPLSKQDVVFHVVRRMRVNTRTKPKYFYSKRMVSWKGFVSAILDRGDDGCWFSTAEAADAYAKKLNDKWEQE